MKRTSMRNIRGVKRKGRGGDESEEDEEAKLRRILDRALRNLRKVVKKVRIFEIQKTLKKLKEVRHEDPDSEAAKDLGAQLKVLKYLNHDQLAHTALVTKLKKDKMIFANPLVQGISVELTSSVVPPGVPGTPAAKVQSRILSSKVIASDVVSIVESLRTFLNPPVGSKDSTGNSRASPNALKRRRMGTGRETNTLSSKANIAISGDEASDEGTSGGGATAGDDGWESGTVDMSSGSGGSVAGSADDRDSCSDDSNDVKCGDENENEDEDEFRPEEPLGSSKVHEAKGQSEFLPSLSVGFTRGNSDSEFSDSETRFADGIKKNRRGQRARRAIWEKKFGKNANHIKKRQLQEMARGSKRHPPDSVRVDQRSGKANSLTHRVPNQGHKPILGSEGGQNSGSTKGQWDCAQRQVDPGKRRERPLHPSWEAKMKQRAARIVPSLGTKFVFSE